MVTGTAAQAQIYRCGGTTYSQVPCSNGRLVEASDPRSAAQRAEARRVAAKEKRLAAELERDRRAKEAAAAATGASGIAATPAEPASAVDEKPKKGRAKRIVGMKQTPVARAASAK